MVVMDGKYATAPEKKELPMASSSYNEWKHLHQRTY
jgi:hypothetical protein